MSDTKEKYIVPSVEQAVQILLCLSESESPQMSLLKISAEVGIHKSKAFSILHTLNKFEIVQKKGNKKGYSLGPGLIPLSRRFLENFDARALAEPILKNLATKGGGTAAFGLIDGDSAYIVAKTEGVQGFGIVTNYIGQRFPITLGSAGKAFAASLSEEDLNRLLENDDLCFYGEPEKMDRARLAKELKQARKNGYAIDVGDIISKINAVSAVVTGKYHTPVGYIILFGLFGRGRLKDLGPLVAEGAKTLSRQIDF